jgi:general secretion pathway protein L
MLARRPRSAPAVWPLGRGAPPAGRFVALVPGEGVPLLPVSLPPALRGAARLAVGQQQVRDRLGQAAARLDLRAAALAGSGGDAGGGWTGLLAADRADLVRWRAALGPAQARVQALIPDYLALPQAPGLWVLAADADGRIRARLGPADGFAAEAGLAAVMLATARARGPEPQAVLVTEGPLPPGVGDVLNGLRLVDDAAHLPPGVAAPRTLALGELALDLRSDPLTRAGALAARLRGLALPAVLAGLGLGGWAASVAVETASLHAQATARQTAILQAVRRDILPEGPILDIRLQVAREIALRQAAADGAGRMGVLDLLHSVAPALAAAGAVPQSLTVTAGAGGGASAPGSDVAPATTTAQLDLILPDFAALELVVAALREAGLAVTVTRSGTADGGQVGAGLTLRPDDGPDAGGGAP